MQVNIEKKYEINGDVEVHIAGETDNTPVKGILYSGEYGDLQNMPLAMYTEIQFPIFLQTNKYSELPNEKITLTTNSIFKDNKTLSFLRGYAFWDLIRRKSDIVIKQPTSYYQYGKINSLQGGNYRKVTVLIFAKNIKPK